jgi:methionine-rich copper-binding protein CopC
MVIAAVTGAAVAIAMLVSIAAAHPVLVESLPAAGTTGAPPDRLVLRFNSRVEKALSSVTLIGGSETPSRALLALEPGTAPEVLVFRLPALTPGRYEARWTVLAADGHVGRGVVTFTVARTE